ncbi:MAG: MFS transporter [Myxococcales bacterium]|nr:MFS transporter [Myxococcales bacterium]MCB9705125.1 MFS transporter [Myxococcales bacterium]
MPADPSPAPDRPRAPPPALWTGTTYFAEGLPWSILHQIAAELFTALGLPARQVGYTSALHLTSTLKFAWSPIVDLFGTLRRWMIATQALMGVVVGLVAVLAHALAEGGGGGGDTGPIWICLVIIGVLSATHDIACDGYYMDALGKDDQARYSGVRVAAFRAAMLVGSSGLVYLGGRVSWLLAFGAAAAILGGLALLHRLILPHGAAEAERPRPRVAPRGEAALSHVLQAYLSFLTQPRAIAVLAFILSFKLGDALMFSMSKVLFRELGVTTAARGVLNGFGTAAAIAGAIVAGAWIARVTLTRALPAIALMMAASEPLYLLLAGDALGRRLAVGLEAPSAALALLSPAHATVGVILVLEQLFGGMATAAQMVFIMRRCHPDHKAAHFAFATAVYALAQTVTGTYSGVFYETHGAITYFGLTSLACVPCLLLLPRVPTHPTVASGAEAASG